MAAPAQQQWQRLPSSESSLLAVQSHVRSLQDTIAELETFKQDKERLETEISRLKVDHEALKQDKMSQVPSCHSPLTLSPHYWGTLLASPLCSLDSPDLL